MILPVSLSSARSTQEVRPVAGCRHFADMIQDDAFQSVEAIEVRATCLLRRAAGVEFPVGRISNPASARQGRIGNPAHGYAFSCRSPRREARRKPAGHSWYGLFSSYNFKRFLAA